MFDFKLILFLMKCFFSFLIFYKKLKKANFFIKVEFFIYPLVYLLVIVLLIVSVAFFTLLERKILATIQYRQGPNKIG